MATVTTSIEADGTVHVSVDSEGIEGDHYSPDVLADLATRSSSAAVAVWREVHGSSDDEGSDTGDGGDGE